MLVPEATELIASTYRHGSKEENAQAFFESGMRETFTRSFAALSCGSTIPLTVYYAFKQQDAGFLQGAADVNGMRSTGWETMLTSLIESGFSIVGTWPIRTERITAHERQEAQTPSHHQSCSSAVPRPEDAPATSRRRFLDALRAELPAAIAEMKTGSIAPVDLAQASIGPGMAIYSRYSRVLEADGSPLTVRTR